MDVAVMAGVVAKADVAEALDDVLDVVVMGGVSNARYVYGVLNAGDVSFAGPLFLRS